jgi:AAA+ ATPase superfamily predicted ATPase
MSFFERFKKIAEETTAGLNDKMQQTALSFGDQLKQTEKIKPALINQAVALDYDMVLNSIRKLNVAKKRFVN